MNFYLVKRIGTGTAADPYRPDLPAGTSWVGVERQGVYLLGVEGKLPAGSWLGPYERLHDKVKQAVTERGRTIDELNVWRAAAR